MKATGIVRRIDDLGRVVIPKEIRRTMRLKDGDALEIYTDSDGEVIFKKYSPIGELSPFAGQYAEAIYKNCDLPTVITDNDHVIACSGVPKRELADRRLTPACEELLENRRSFVMGRNVGSHRPIKPIEGVERYAGIVFPIISAGDAVGTVIILGDGTSAPSETAVKLAQVAASFLGKQMEE